MQTRHEREEAGDPAPIPVLGGANKQAKVEENLCPGLLRSVPGSGI